MEERVSIFRIRERRRRNRRFRILKDWYGSDYASTEMAAHTAQPEPVKAVMDHLVSVLSTPEVRLFLQISTRWQEIAGMQLSRLATPLKLADGILFLEVRHSALLRELAPSLDLILKQIRKSIPDSGLCKEVKLVISGGGRSFRDRR